MPTAMPGVKKEVLPKVRGEAGAADAGASSGTEMRAIHATARSACVALASRNCQIKEDAKRMHISKAVKAMAARQCEVQKERKRGQTLQACPLPKGLQQKWHAAEDSTKIKTQGKRQTPSVEIQRYKYMKINKEIQIRRDMNSSGLELFLPELGLVMESALL